MRAEPAPRILTANDLVSGLSVFLAEDGSWTEDWRKARVAGDAGSAALLEAAGQAAVAANRVVGAYLVEVRVGVDGAPEPVHYRERLRVLGRPSFWRQAAAPATDRKEAPQVKKAPHVSL